MKIAAAIVLALIAAAAAAPRPFGGVGGVGVVSKNTHVSSGIVSPYLGYGMGLGYGMMGLGYPVGVGIGNTIVSHSTVGHAVPHVGLGLLGLNGLAFAGMYPGGIGLGYGIMGGHGHLG